MVYRTCHQCLLLVEIADVAHVDLFADVCWVQCVACAAKFGQLCGVSGRFDGAVHVPADCPYKPLEVAANQLLEELSAPER